MKKSELEETVRALTKSNKKLFDENSSLKKRVINIPCGSRIDNVEIIENGKGFQVTYVSSS